MHMRNMIAPLGLFFTSFLLCVGLVAAPSGCTKNTRDHAVQTELATVDAAVTATDAAYAQFVAWDAATRASIVEHATDRADVLAKLTAQDQRIVPIQALFVATYQALRLATSKPSDLTVGQAVKVSTAVIAAFTKLRGGS